MNENLFEKKEPVETLLFGKSDDPFGEFEIYIRNTYHVPIPPAWQRYNRINEKDLFV